MKSNTVICKNRSGTMYSAHIAQSSRVCECRNYWKPPYPPTSFPALVQTNLPHKPVSSKLSRIKYQHTLHCVSKKHPRRF